MGSSQVRPAQLTDEAAAVALRREVIDAKLRAMLESAALPPGAPGLDDMRLAEPLPSGEDELRMLDDLFTATEKAMKAVTEKLLPAPLLAARRVNLALDHVQAGTTLTDVMRAVPSELCWAGDFDRVLFSRVEESFWVPATWYTTDSGAATVAFGQLVHGARFALTNGSIEAEIVRRRVTALVTDAAGEPRTFPPLLSVAECESYVVAPVVSGDAVVGLLHADAAASGRPLTEADRVTLRAFADGVGLILERMALVEALAKQRRLIAEALSAAERAVSAIADAPVSLESRSAERVLTPGRTEDRPSHAGLTAREREVFALLVSGATNAEIADRLTVSETTVKSHVKHILRKMHVGNRAEAIAKYLRDGNYVGVSR